MIQALRIKGASRIIAVDTLASKGELALKLGATDFEIAVGAELAKQLAHGRAGRFGHVHEDELVGVIDDHAARLQGNSLIISTFPRVMHPGRLHT